jgi:hypothetical protein
VEWTKTRHLLPARQAAASPPPFRPEQQCRLRLAHCPGEVAALAGVDASRPDCRLRRKRRSASRRSSEVSELDQSGSESDTLLSVPTKRLIGHVGVDAGVVVVGDPCYLVAGGSQVNPQWDDVVKQIFDAQNPGRIEGTSAVQVEGTIMTITPAGDDMYPVYAELADNGQVLSLRVDPETFRNVSCGEWGRLDAAAWIDFHHSRVGTERIGARHPQLVRSGHRVSGGTG